jgi:hypothetical protein
MRADVTGLEQVGLNSPRHQSQRPGSGQRLSSTGGTQSRGGCATALTYASPFWLVFFQPLIGT